MTDIGVVGSASVVIDPDFTGFAAKLKSQLIPILNQVSGSVKAIDISVKDLTKSLQGSVVPAQSLNAALDGVDAGDLTAVSGAASSAAASLSSMAASAEATNVALDAIDPNDLVQVSAAAQGASGSLAGTTAAAKTTEGSLISLGSVAKGLAIGAAIGGAAVLGLGGIGVKVAGDMEQTRIAFEGLFGNTQMADEFLTKLKDFAATTPFEFDQVTKATQKLISLGQTGDEAIKTLTTIGNAAAAVGAPAESIDRVVLALSQIQAKGKLSAEELNQIAEALPNFDRGAFLDKLAASMGKTREEVAKLAEQGKITAKQAMPALMASLEGAKGAMGAMERQSKTLIGQLSTFKDVVKNKMIDAFTPLLPVISQTLAPLGESLGSIFTAVAPLFESLVKLIGPLVTALTPVINALATTLAPVITALTPHLTKFAEVLAGGLVAFLEAMGPALVTIVDALGPILPAIAELATVFLEALAPAVVELVKSGIVPLIKEVLPILVELFQDPTFVDTVKQLALAFTDIAVALVQTGLLQAVIDLVAQMALPAIGLFRDAIIAIRDTMASPEFQEGMRIIKEAIQTTFGTNPGEGGSLVEDWKNSFNSAIEDHRRGWDIIGEKGTWFKDHVLDPLVGTAQDFWENWQGWSDTAHKWFMDIGEAATQWGVTVTDAFRILKDDILDPIIGVFQTVWDWVTKLSDGIKGLWDKIPDPLKSAMATGSGIPLLPFAEGGVVPGPIGAPVPALVHGGEVIIPPGLIDGLSGGSSVPFIGPSSGSASGSPVQIFVTVPPGTSDPQSFGAAVGSATGDAFVAKTNMKVAVRTSPSSAR